MAGGSSQQEAARNPLQQEPRAGPQVPGPWAGFPWARVFWTPPLPEDALASTGRPCGACEARLQPCLETAPGHDPQGLGATTRLSGPAPTVTTALASRARLPLPGDTCVLSARPWRATVAPWTRGLRQVWWAVAHRALWADGSAARGPAQVGRGQKALGTSLGLQLGPAAMARVQGEGVTARGHSCPSCHCSEA